MEFYEKLKKLRTEKGISQQELADKIFVSRSAVAKWENGLGLPCKESMKLICDFFEVEESALVREDEDANVQKNRKIFQYKKLLIIACAVVFVLIALTITGLSLYFGGAISSKKATYPDAYPDDFPYLTVEGVNASYYVQTTPTKEHSNYISVSSPYGEDAKALPLLPYKNVYSVSLPDEAILDQPRYYFLNDDYSNLTSEDNLYLSATPLLPISPATMWFTTEYFRCAGVDSDKGEVTMNFKNNKYKVIIVEFKYYWKEFSGISYFRVER